MSLPFAHHLHRRIGILLSKTKSHGIGYHTEQAGGVLQNQFLPTQLTVVFNLVWEF